MCSAMILWLAAASPSATDLLKSPPMARSEQGSTVTKAKNGTVRSKARWTLDRSDGKDVVKMTETGQGIFSGFDQEVHWNIEASWSNGTSFRPLAFEKTISDNSGKVLLREIKQFNWTSKEVRFERHDLKSGKTTTRVLAVPPDTLAVEGIAAALRALPFEASRPFPAHFLTNEPKLYNITLEVRGREKVQTPAGSFDCYKVELVPHLGVLDAFHFLFPKIYFWLTVDSQHTLVRYQGPESTPGSQEIILDRAD
jgi:uncharacterized protein DUF3108